MKKIKVAGAANVQLDWLIARLQGYLADAGEKPTEALAFRARHAQGLKRYSSSPQLMHPIIEREKISTDWDHDVWNASAYGHPFYTDGPTALIAAARCYVVSRRGEEVEVPDELC